MIWKPSLNQTNPKTEEKNFFPLLSPGEKGILCSSPKDFLKDRSKMFEQGVILLKMETSDPPGLNSSSGQILSARQLFRIAVIVIFG